MDVEQFIEECRKKGLIAHEGKKAVLPAPSAAVGVNAAMKPGQSEAEFTAELIEYAQARGWKVAHFRGVRVARKDGSTYWQTPVQGDGAGFPDLILVRGKRILAAELKVGKNTLDEKQKVWLAVLEAAGVECFEWRPEDWGQIETTLAV